MAWFDTLLSGAGKAVDVYGKARTVKSQTAPQPVQQVARVPVKRQRVAPVAAPVQQSFLQQNQNALLGVGALLVLLVIVKKSGI